MDDRTVLVAGFVGRDQELAGLAAALAGDPSVVLVEGEAGIGKTRLLHEYLHSAAGHRRTALVTGCPPFREPHTLAPLVDALHANGHQVGELPLSPLAGALRPLFPDWADHLPPTPDPVEDARAARHRLFRALLEVLRALRVDLLVVEDAHWADEATLEFLLFLATCRPQPLSLLVSYRPEDVPEESLLPRLSTRTTPRRITLPPLDVGDTAGLVSSMLDGKAISTGFAAFLHEHTAGIPLLAEESVRLLHDRGDLVAWHGEWIRRRIDAIVVPPTVRDAVLERTRHLAPDARTLLDAAAVLTHPAEETTLAAVTGLSVEQTRGTLTQVLAAGLLHEDDRGLVSFRHALAAQAVHDAIPGPHRRTLHNRAAATLDALGAPPARLAHHHRHAGNSARWADHTERAADAALAAGDEATAATLLHDLLINSALTADTTVRLVAKLPFEATRGPAYLNDCVRVLRAALVDTRLSRQQAALAHLHLGQVLIRLERTGEGTSELAQAVPHLDPPYAAYALNVLGYSDDATPVSEHRRRLRQAADVAQNLPPRRRLSFAVVWATNLLMLGEDSGWAEMGRALAEAHQLGAYLEETGAHLNASICALGWGRDGDAAGHVSAGRQLARQHQYPRFQSSIEVSQLQLDWFGGNWDGLAEFAARIAVDDALGAVTRTDGLLVVGLLHLATGNHGAAATNLELAYDTCHGPGTTDPRASLAAALIRLRLAGGDVGAALAVSEELTERIAAKGAWLWGRSLVPARVEALLAAGDTDRAGDLVEAFSRGLRARAIPSAAAALVLCRAMLAGGQRQHARAAGLYGKAAAAFDAVPRPYDALLVREHQAACLLAAGRVEDGLTLLTETYTGLSTLGATGDAARVAGRLREHGVPVRRATRRGYGDQLSPRELEVVRLVATGLTNRQIAEELSRSPKTVAVQIHSARRKLRASTRTALAVAALEAGLAGSLGDDNDTVRKH